MEENKQIAKNQDNKDGSKNVLVIDTDKLETAITNAVKPLVELWIDKSNETEQLRINKEAEVANRRIEHEAMQSRTSHTQYKIYVAILVGIVITAIVLEVFGKFSQTIGIIATAIIILCVNNIGLPKNKSRD